MKKAVSTTRVFHLITAALLASLAACGGAAPNPGAVQALNSGSALTVVNQGSRLLVGTNRVSVALFTGKDAPVENATATLAVADASARVIETRPLHSIGPVYGHIPVYVGTARFDAAGTYTYTVQAALPGGIAATGTTTVHVTTQSPELPVNFTVPAGIAERTLADVHGDVGQLDTGVPPDGFHDHSIAQGLAAHHPMVLYFGQPGRCASQTCGPTVRVLQDFAKTYGSRLWIEHIEVHDPAQSEALNIAYLRFGLSSEPWIYFVNAGGVVTDRFEGPITTSELVESAEGTLAGRVPAVSIAG